MAKTKTVPSADNRSVVLEACRAMARPLVRLLLKSGIVHRELVSLTREVYVEVARNEFGMRGRPTSISRTALLTGLARKEVSRIMANAAGEVEVDAEPVPNTQDRVSRLLSAWYQDPVYLDQDRKPRALPVKGPRPSFATLKAFYGGDVPASTILRELVSAGTVKVGDDGLLRPVYRNYAPNPTDPEHLVRAGSVIEDIGFTVTHNLFRTEKSAALFERRAINTAMPESSLVDFKAFLNSEGQRFLERVDTWLSNHESPDSSDTGMRLGLGMYLIKKDADKPQDGS